jgi:hypothetical protein
VWGAWQSGVSCAFRTRLQRALRERRRNVRSAWTERPETVVAAWRRDVIVRGE